MGCSHCMNNALPNNKHMDFETFKKAIEFQSKYGTFNCIISGGEPTEHPDFINFLKYATEQLRNKAIIIVTTNGVWMQNNYDFIKYMFDTVSLSVIFQVTTVDEYYPIHIDTSLPVFSIPNVCVCTKIENMYPIGRAKDNNLPSTSKASKCFNIRAITSQVETKNLAIIIAMLAVKGYFCTPHIDIYGNIKLGESDLCPSCSHIDKGSYEIIDDILNFRCNQCKEINSKLSEEYRKLIGD